PRRVYQGWARAAGLCGRHADSATAGVVTGRHRGGAPRPDRTRRAVGSAPDRQVHYRTHCHETEIFVAGGLGFEPRLTESESAVLPLNYPPIASYFNNLAIWTKPQTVAVQMAPWLIPAA